MFSDTFYGETQELRNAEVDEMFESLEEMTAFEDADGNPLLFRFSISQTTDPVKGDYGSVEWSSQVAIAYLEAAYYFIDLGDEELAEKYLTKYNVLMDSLKDYFVVPADDPLSLIAPYASYFVDHSVAGDVPTGTGYYTFNCQGALASSYYAIALTEGLKPWKYEYEDGEVVKVTLLNGSIIYNDIETSPGRDESLIVAYLSDDSAEELCVDFGTTYGLYLYDNSTWSQINAISPSSMGSADIDADGSKEIIANFAGYGLYLYDNSTWSVLNTETLCLYRLR